MGPGEGEKSGVDGMTDDKHEICKSCGHFRFLHLNFAGECEACDSPEYRPEVRCAGLEEEANG